MHDDSTPDFDAERTIAAVGDARTVLLLAADDDPLADECCVSLASAGSPADARLLSVTVGGPPDGRLAAWRTHAGGRPARTGVVAVGETTRGAATTDGGSVAPGNGPVSVDALPDPADLAGLALAVAAYLDAWDDASSDPDDAGAAGHDASEPADAPAAPTAVCLHSLSGLLEATDVERVFRFLHATSGLLRAHGARAHVHLDPDEHDAATVDTLRVLFDAVVRIEADGSASVDAG